MSSNEVSVVLVHGAWADGSGSAKVIGSRAAEGIGVAAAPLPLTSFRDDVGALDRTLARAAGRSCRPCLYRSRDRGDAEREGQGARLCGCSARPTASPEPNRHAPVSWLSRT